MVLSPPAGRSDEARPKDNAWRTMGKEELSESSSPDTSRPRGFTDCVGARPSRWGLPDLRSQISARTGVASSIRKSDLTLNLRAGAARGSECGHNEL